MRVVVTGGSGFIGSHIVEHLIEQGHTPVIVDNLSSGVDFTPPGVEVHRRDIVRDDLEPLLRDAEGIIHAAAYADLRANWQGISNRTRLTEQNVNATIAVLEQMPPVPIVFLSTAAVYGASKGHWVQEWQAHPETIESPYAASKMAAECFVAAYAYAREHRWYAARLVNVVGARTRHGVIGDFVRMAREGHIHAKDNGHQRKSWVHVRDVANAVRRMVTGEPKHGRVPPSGVYTISSRERISWWDIVDAMGWPKERVTWEDREGGAIGDPVDLTVFPSLLEEFVGPAHSAIADGIREALEDLQWGKEQAA